MRCWKRRIERNEAHFKTSKWSGRADLNRGPPAPKAGALPGCATPRHELRQDYKGLPNRTVAPSDRSRPQVSCGIVRCEKIAKRPPSDSPEFLSRFHGWDTRGAAKTHSAGQKG